MTPTSPVIRAQKANDETLLLKLLTLLIRRAGGEIRIPAADLHVEDQGEGFTRYWDATAKELVLRFSPKGADVFVIKEDATWQGTKIDKGPRSLDPQAPLTREQLLSLEWARTHGRTVAETDFPREVPAPPYVNSTQPPPTNRTILTDERLAEMESERIKQDAMRAIHNFQPEREPSPRPSPAPRGERIVFSQPSKTVKVPVY